MTEIKQIDDMCKKNQSNLECIQNDQSSLLTKLKDLQELLSKFDKQLDLVKTPSIIHIDCKNLRDERQIDNNNTLLSYIYIKKKRYTFN
jgi:tRNA(Phe) wybutosine-synthesizing methylase Tyw3